MAGEWDLRQLHEEHDTSVIGQCRRELPGADNTRAPAVAQRAWALLPPYEQLPPDLELPIRFRVLMRRAIGRSLAEYRKVARWAMEYREFCLACSSRYFPPNSPDAEDVVNEAWMEFIAHGYSDQFHETNDRGRLLALIATVIRNRSRNRIRRIRRIREHETEPVTENIGGDTVDVITGLIAAEKSGREGHENQRAVDLSEILLEQLRRRSATDQDVICRYYFPTARDNPLLKNIAGPAEADRVLALALLESWLARLEGEKRKAFQSYCQIAKESPLSFSAIRQACAGYRDDVLQQIKLWQKPGGRSKKVDGDLT